MAVRISAPNVLRANAISLPAEPSPPSSTPLYGPGAGVPYPGDLPQWDPVIPPALNQLPLPIAGATPATPAPVYLPQPWDGPAAPGGNFYGYGPPGGASVSMFPTTWVYRDTPNGPQWVPRAEAANPSQDASDTSGPYAGVGPQANPGDSAGPGGSFWNGLLGINASNI